MTSHDTENLASYDTQRYYFGNKGVVKEVALPNKLVLLFKLNGKEERCVMLTKHLLIDGNTYNDTKPLTDQVQVSDIIRFDCHIYDKGGIGSGKDKANYFAMKGNLDTSETARMQQNTNVSFRSSIQQTNT